MASPVASVETGVFLPNGIPHTRYKDDLVVERMLLDGSDSTEEIHAYMETDSGLLLPRSYGLGHIHKYPHKIETSPVQEASVGHLSEIELRPKQKPIVDAWHDAVVSGLMHGVTDFIVKAPTGTGKTVMCLEVLRRVGAKAIILVDQEKLLKQWIERAEEHLGVDPSEVGIIQGKTRTVGDFLTVGMIQTLYRMADNPEDREWLIDQFTIVAIDETHVAGAPMFSRVLFLFAAPVRFGMSATPDRRDVLDKVLKWHLGDIGVELRITRQKSKLRYLRFPYTTSWYSIKAKNAGKYITEIANHPIRNHLLAAAILDLYDHGRTILAVSDRTEQLSALKGLLVAWGVPEDDIGICARYRSEWRYVKNPTPKRNPVGTPRGAEYCPVKLDFVSVRNPPDVVDAAAQKPIVLATYGLFEKGVDVPQLDTGIDLTPRAAAEQAHGRILREMAGKKTPMWVTIRDYNSARSEVQFLKRLDDYLKSNVEVFEWQLDKGTRKVEERDLKMTVRSRIASLKGREIAMNADGNYIVMM